MNLHFHCLWMRIRNRKFMRTYKVRKEWKSWLHNVKFRSRFELSIRTESLCLLWCLIDFVPKLVSSRPLIDLKCFRMKHCMQSLGVHINYFEFPFLNWSWLTGRMAVNQEFIGFHYFYVNYPMLKCHQLILYISHQRFWRQTNFHLYYFTKMAHTIINYMGFL